MKQFISNCTLLVVTPLLMVAALPARPGMQARGDNRSSLESASHIYRSPNGLAISPDAASVYACDETARSLVILDVALMAKRGEVPLRGRPGGVAASRVGGVVYVAERGAGSVAVVDPIAERVVARIDVGKWPAGLALAERSQRLYVCNQDRHTVSVVDVSQSPPRAVTEIPVIREPVRAAVTPQEEQVVVVNLLALGVGTDPALSAEVSIIDTATHRQTAQVKLPPGSTMVRGMCISPDGRWAYVVHGLGRFNLPITQLERGWVNTYALSIIDVENASRLVTVLLDDLTQGAADPDSVVCSPDGTRLWISHAGVHEVSIVEIAQLHELFQGNVPSELAQLKDGMQPNIWVQIQQDRRKRTELANDLTALYIAGAIRRVSSGGIGPRGLVLSPDAQSLLVANYYSGTVAVLDAATGSRLGSIALGTQPEDDSVRRGEIIFHDATHAFQRWHSCASCHANEGRVDGLRWDFLGDGIGNAKDTLSLVFFHETAPMNRRATVDSAKACARNGLESTNMLVPTEQEVEDLYAYLISLRPEPSPYLKSDGELSQAAARGKVLFEGKARCASCHPAPYFTDKSMHNVGVLSANEPDGRYDTPSLIEAYRTAPYLHDGRALTIKDVLTHHNEKGRHGKADTLTELELDDLVAYLLSL